MVRVSPLIDLVKDKDLFSVILIEMFYPAGVVIGAGGNCDVGVNRLFEPAVKIVLIGSDPASPIGY